jgi:putative intracellular protease/amidase
MKKTCYLFIFDGFADYETSPAAVGIGNSDQYQLKTIAMSKQPVRSMSGMTVVPDCDFIPDVDLDDIEKDNTAMLVLPGGSAWQEKKNESIRPLTTHCLLSGIPVAAICGATIFLADLGVLNHTNHTSNSKDYLSAMSTNYHGEALYRNEPAVCTEFLITANGTASIDFAQDIFDLLEIADDHRVIEWFQYFQHQLA